MTARQPFSLTIAHINDTHSHFESTPVSLSLDSEDTRVYANCGGFARIASAVKHFRHQAEQNQHGFLFLHAGDCFQGTLYYSLFKGKANADMLNRLGIDAMAIGNHELDQGNGPVADFLDDIKFPLLAGNWHVDDEAKDKQKRVSDKPSLMPYLPEHARASTLIKTYAGHQVGLFSLAVEQMAALAHPDHDTPFLPATQIAKNTVAYLRAQGVNTIILLSHLGYDKDKALAAAVKGIDVIVGGHTHVLQGDFQNIGLEAQDPYGYQVNDTWIVQAGCHAQSIGRFTLSIDEKGRPTAFNGQNYVLLGRSLAMDASREQQLTDTSYQAARDYLNSQSNVLILPSDLDLKHHLQQTYRPQVAQLERDIVTHVPERLRHVRVPDGEGSSDVAPLVTESFLWAAREQGIDAEFAIHNAGGVRVGLNAGPLSAALIAGTLLPFAIDVIAYRVTGEQIRNALEGAINNATNNGVAGLGTGSFPYCAAIRYRYEAWRPMGQRITQLEIKRGEHWVAMDDEHRYTGVSSSYTAQGKEGYDALQTGRRRSIGLSMAECFIRYARQQNALALPSQPLVCYLSTPDQTQTCWGQ
ncbi:bifunctional metallophosphatase/5'-nucleotidase [Salinivibrio costicola]|uniref:Bifunctional metallophosphatase/5'-nucleotidase n=1 Tax=Salinivibrio costicola subsp. alcaliphilus TaxID=272773 RepID=A0ABX3KSP1_SALCS|nr:bifunctional UDP-sugar hydrolase/5'-nucleotidase [Salinivibrio costicola]OOF34746.1 bifunctional metallophosphatase/5'-nucleotidase [Salinivibrio costicola subsp. alcaliphilus]